MPSRLIVDNSHDDALALDYVREWCEVSEAIDIATGHFEIGALLALDGHWQSVEHIRILIGGDTSPVTASIVSAALDESFVVERSVEDPFLDGVDDVIEAIRSGQIQINVYRPRKFHAKAYITRARGGSPGPAVLVGSSNFTRPGLTRNVELNVRVAGSDDVDELRAWFKEHWDDSEPVNAALLTVIERQTQSFSPFEIYATALRALTAEAEPGEREWEQSESQVYPLLAPYQAQAYRGLRSMARRWNGGFLTDGVGLGKTFVGLMLAEYYAIRERKNVLILATKTGQDAVWLPELERRLPGLAGDEFSNVRVRAHTDLSTKDAPALVERLRERVDVVIVDEAHNFRNHGPKGEGETESKSRWWRLQEVCEGKTVFLLTATPINNTLFDLVHQAEMFTGMDDAYFSSVGVSSLQRYVARLEKPFRDAAREKGTAASIDLSEFDALLQQDEWLESIIWQNSRKYAVESSRLAGGADVLFPTMEPPQVVEYELLRQHRHLLEELETAFRKQEPLFVLPMYYPLAYSRDPDIDATAENRQRQIVGLIRTTFLKRFESSVASFAGSCLDLTAKILVWLDANVRGDRTFADRLRDWHERNDDLLQRVHDRYRPTMEMPDTEIPSDLTPEEFEELAVFLDDEEFRVADMVEAAFEDLFQLARFLERIADVGIAGDDKYDRLRDLLMGPRGKGSSDGLDPNVFTEAFRTQKVLVFTEFADTARYLHDRLVADGLKEVDRLDGSRKADRVQMIQRFAPHYNKVGSEDRAALAPLRVLVSTDVLSEGVNLQDGTLIINFDLHWNPVRLMQRIGRVDRRMDAEIEQAIVAENPRAKPTRGVVQVRNFLPPDALEILLRLHQRVETKVLMISRTLGIPGGKLLKPDDMLDDVRVMQQFIEDYEGSLSPIERLRLRYQQLQAEVPGLDDHLDALPRGIGSAKSGAREAVFVCRAYPTLVKGEASDGTDDYWSMERPRIAWALRGPDDEEALIDESIIDGFIEATVNTPREPVHDRPAVAKALRALEADGLRGYRKAVQLPLDAPPPHTVCWMALQ